MNRMADGTFAAVPLMERFMRHVRQLDSGCWEWTGARCGERQGRGQSSLPGGRKTLAYRVAWILHRGPIPSGMKVCHRCDVPLCVNPDHLFLGTQKENIQDAVKKGHMRGPGTRGETHSRARLTEVQVLEIRRRAAGPINVCAIAREYGVSRGTVRLILDGTNWRHLLPEAEV